MQIGRKFVDVSIIGGDGWPGLSFLEGDHIDSYITIGHEFEDTFSNVLGVRLES